MLSKCCSYLFIPGVLSLGVFAIGVSPLVMTTAQAAMPKVGVAAVVNPATTGRPQGGRDRVIVVGDNMLHNERIDTSDQGRTQLLFIDGTALTIGPNSSVVLDEFVYDPNTKLGKLAFSATKGLFRLVGGKISKKRAVIFKTPTAIIGIRGGIGIISIRERKRQARLGGGLTAGTGADRPSSAGTLRLAQTGTATNVVTTAQLAFGQKTVESGGVTRAITTPGFQVVSVSAVVAPSRPAPAPPDGGLGDKLSGLEGPGGDSTGGAPEAPTNEDVAETQISRMGSNIQPQSIVVAPKFSDAPPPPPPGGVVKVGKKLLLIGRNTIIAEQNNTLDTTAGTTAGMRITVSSSSLSYSGRFLSQTPFIGFDFNTLKTTAVSQRNNRGSGGRIENGFLTA